MASPPYTRLKGISNAWESLIINQLESNLMTFFEWGLLEVGGYFDVRVPTSGAYGGDFSRLRSVKDPRYTNGQVYESARCNWVWQSGVEYSTGPIQISGVRVNNTFYPTSTTGSFSHYYDYTNGRVIFNSPISGNVNLEYSYNWVNFISADSRNFREAQYNSFRVDKSEFLAGSGDWYKLAETRVQLPAVAVEVTPNTRLAPYQLGGGQYLYQDIKFHILAETPWERNQILNVIVNQNEKTINVYNMNWVHRDNRFPLDHRNMVVSGALNYSLLTRPTGDGGYAWRTCRMDKMRTTTITPHNINLFYGVVASTMEIVMPDI